MDYSQLGKRKRKDGAQQQGQDQQRQKNQDPAAAAESSFQSVLEQEEQGQQKQQQQPGTAGRPAEVWLKSSDEAEDESPSALPSPLAGARLAGACQQFEEDALAQAHGLVAVLSGEGPGLRVLLQDRSGTLIRQLSPAEFVHLQEKAPKEVKPCGKILDQKL